MTSTDAAADAIARYAYGMDSGDFASATRVFAAEADIDYGQVGGPVARMTRSALAAFLTGLLGRAELRVHTAIGQVLADPDDPDAAIAYYTVRHYRGDASFVLFGWYRIRIGPDGIVGLAIHVQATEGDPAVLAP